MAVISSNDASKDADPEFFPMIESYYANFLTMGNQSAFTSYDMHVKKRSMTKDSTKKTKRLCVPATKHDKDGSEEKEDKVDLKRNEESANRKFKLFGCEIEIPKKLVDEENKENLYIEKNEELANGKLKLFGREIEIPEQVMEPDIKKKSTKNVGLATKTATKISPPLLFEEGENKQNKKRKMPTKKAKRGPVVISNEMNERLERFVTSDEMNGSDLKLVIQKRLFMSDLKGDQNRLNMPMKQLQTLEFLKPEEKATIDKEEGIKVGLVGPTLQMYKEQMVLKKWYMLRTSNYVLMNNWNHFVYDYKNDLKVDTMIQVWSFRRNHKDLCFALVIVGDEENHA